MKGFCFPSKSVQLNRGDVAAVIRSHMKSLQPFESVIEQTTEIMPPSHKTITAAGMTTNRITSLRELLHYRKTCEVHAEATCSRDMQQGTKSQHLHTHENVGGACPRDMLHRTYPLVETDIWGIFCPHNRSAKQRQRPESFLCARAHGKQDGSHQQRCSCCYF